MDLDYLYTSTKIKYRGFDIQTYRFGHGDKVIMSFPSFPHSGLYYLWFLYHYDLSKVSFITFDFPGWVGNSENIFESESFSFDEYINIAIAVIDHYQVKKLSLLGYSFGGALAASVAIKIPDIVHRIVLVSAVVDFNLLKGYRSCDLVYWAHAHKLAWAFKLYLILRFRYYENALKKEKMPNKIISEYEHMINKANGKVLLESLYNLFCMDLTPDLKTLNGKNIMVVSSINETLYLRKQSEHIRRVLKGERTLFIDGSHEDFILKPKNAVVKTVVDYLVS